MMSSPYGTISHFQRWKHCEHSVVESESLSRCHPEFQTHICRGREDGGEVTLVSLSAHAWHWQAWPKCGRLTAWLAALVAAI